MRRRVHRSHSDRLPARSARQAVAQAGALPEIRLQGESVVFYLDIATERGMSRLSLRCDADGNVWASTITDVDPVD
jgi:hypothetical protein